jgi:hypothetical protein
MILKQGARAGLLGADQRALQEQIAAQRRLSDEMRGGAEVGSMLDRLQAAQAERESLRDAAFADTFYRQLYNSITQAHAVLRQDEQLEVYCYLKAGECLQVTDLDYKNPHLIILHGKDAEGSAATVLVHMASMQLVMRTTKLKKTESRREIGFRSPVPKDEPAPDTSG